MVQEAVTRLGSRLPYREAQEELERMWGVEISVDSVRQITMRHGRVADECLAEAVEQIESQAPAVTATPEQLLLATDGAFIQLTNGEWREVKTAAIGEFTTSWNQQRQQLETKTSNITYLSRLEEASAFARSALFEWQERGGEKAQRVVAVNDGAAWIQGFLDYHAPAAIRILDFAHAQSHLATIGKAIYGTESAAFAHWFRQVSHQLKTQPPQRLLADLLSLQRQQQDHPQAAEIAQAIRYLHSRQQMIDYAHFQRQQLPIGSGMVESAHKVVVQRRMKQAGMRWAAGNVNPMLALRMALCNQRWSATWLQIHHRTWQHKRQRRLSLVSPTVASSSTTLVTEADCQRLSKLADKIDAQTKRRHPWQNHDWIFPHRRA